MSDALPSATMKRTSVASIARKMQFVTLSVLFNWINVFNPALVSRNAKVAVSTVQTKSALVLIRMIIPTMFYVPPGSSQFT